MDEIIGNVMSKGFYPVLAHPERYNYMNIGDYKKLKDRRVIFQLNVPSLVGAYGEEVKKKAEMLLDTENNTRPVPTYPFFPWVMSCLLQPPPKIELKMFITCSPAGPQPACTLSSSSGSLSPQLTPGLIQWPVTSGSQCVPSAGIH